MKGKIWFLFLVILLLIIPFGFSDKPLSLIEKSIQEDKIPVAVKNIETKEIIKIEVNEKEFKSLKKAPDIEVEFDLPLSLDLTESLPIINGTNIHSKLINGTNITGLNQGICIIDTGVNATHENLIGRVVLGYDFVNDDSDASDDNGHGSHCAGISAGSGSITGVAPNATIVSVKILDSNGDGSTSDIASAIDWCVDNAEEYNITAISMSLGTDVDVYGATSVCDDDWPTTLAAVNNAIAKNIVVVAASGNDYSVTKVGFPACLSNVWAIGATDYSNTITSYSNVNSLVSIVAPGGLSANKIISSNYQGGTTGKYGTSMSTPHVAGAVALLQQYEEDFESNTLTSSQLFTSLNSTGLRIDDTATSGNYYQQIELTGALLSIDNLAPNVSLTPTSFKTNDSNYTIQVTIDDPNFDNITFYLNNDTALVNTTTYTSLVSSITYYNLNDWSNYSVLISAKDSNNQETLYPDSYPILTLNNINSTYYINESIPLNYSVTEPNLDRVWYNIDNGTNSNLDGETTFNTTEGSHMLYLYANDTFGFENYTSKAFTVIIYPTIEHFTNNTNFTTDKKQKLFTFNSSESVNMTYSLDGATNASLCNDCIRGSVTLNFTSFGTHTIRVYAEDEFSNINETGLLTFNLQLDTDNDGDPDFNDTDDDNDGVADATDFVLGSLSNLDTNTDSLNISINGTTNIYQAFEGLLAVNFTKSGNELINFDYNFSSSNPLIFVNVTLDTQGSGQTNGYTLVKGLTSVTKTLYVANLNSSSDSICVKDSEVSSINQITDTCTGTNEYTVACPGTNGSYSCIDIGSYYEVTGLTNSAAKEFIIPTVVQSSSAPSTPSSSSGGGGGGGGSSTPSTTRTIIVPTASSSEPISVTVNSELIPVSALNIAVNQDVSYGKITVTSIDEPSNKADNAYSYFTITIYKISEITSSRVQFKVNKSWLNANGFDVDKIHLQRLETDWETLDTNYLFLEGDQYYFESETNGFSTFAIVGIKETIQEPDLPITTQAMSDIPDKDGEVVDYYYYYYYYYVKLYITIAIAAILFLLGAILILFFLLKRKANS